MTATPKTALAKGKHFLYLFSIALLLLLCGLAFLHSPGNTTHLDFFSAFLSGWDLVLLTLSGAFVLAFALLWLHRRLTALPDAKQRLVLTVLALCFAALQYALLFTIRAVLRYDHLNVFDQALEIFRTGEISMTYADNYFSQYPFNIPVTLFNYGILNIAKFLGVPESGYMLAVQCVYLLGVDLAAYFSYRLIRILRSQKTATLFALLCFVNPLLYMYGFGCYTTILMLPFLTGNLLLFVCMLKEKRPRRKLFLAFCLGLALVAGIKIRANLLITLITFAGYLLIHIRNPWTFIEKKKQVFSLCAAVFLGALLCCGAAASIESRYVKGDYSDTQLPPSYYFLFSAKVDSLGSYNEEDHAFIQSFDTYEEKNRAAWSALFDRLSENGLSGNLFLYDYKLKFTWSDGIDDYAEFLHTTENYGPLHSFLAGSRKDVFALYCHVYHVMIMGLLVCAVVLALRRRCDTPFYMIYLNLLGAMLFHLLWEAGWAYSISFSMLILMLSAEGAAALAEKLSARQVSGSGGAAVSPDAPSGSPQTPLQRVRAALGRAVRPRTAAGQWNLAALLIFLIIGGSHVRALFTVPYKQMEYAVVQDMSVGEDLQPLLTGETISQTFTTDRPFNHIGCKVLNPTGTENASSYLIEVLDMDGNVLGSRGFSGGEVMNKDYCYVKFDSVVPEGETTYEIRITAHAAAEGDALTFLYYNSGSWDIYPNGRMTGVNASEKSDLTFVVYDSVTKCFFN